jgi:hypothetical protein
MFGKTVTIQTPAWKPEVAATTFSDATRPLL